MAGNVVWNMLGSSYPIALAACAIAPLNSAYNPRWLNITSGCSPRDGSSRMRRKQQLIARLFVQSTPENILNPPPPKMHHLQQPSGQNWPDRYRDREVR